LIFISLHLSVGWHVPSAVSLLFDSASSSSGFGKSGLGAAFQTAERLSDPLPFECRLSPLAQSYCASGADDRFRSDASYIECTDHGVTVFVRHAERDSGMRDGATSAERDRIKDLKREVKHLPQANDILRKGEAFGGTCGDTAIVRAALSRSLGQSGHQAANGPARA
jgi:hypothetical protein